MSEGVSQKSDRLVLPLWSDGIPGALQDDSYVEQTSIQHFRGRPMTCITQVSFPTLEVFHPIRKDGDLSSAMIVIPGGGYEALSFSSEGTEVARWLCSRGITAVVLKYRLPSDRIMVEPSYGPLQDAQRAIRLVRSLADELALDCQRIGVIGFSAGGHVAALATVRSNWQLYAPRLEFSARPDLLALVYPVISMEDRMAHPGCRQRLFGGRASRAEIRAFSAERWVSPECPATFIVHAEDDLAVPPENSQVFADSMRQQKVDFQLHLYPEGGHGFGIFHTPTEPHAWLAPFERWLRDKGW